MELHFVQLKSGGGTWSETKEIYSWIKVSKSIPGLHTLWFPSSIASCNQVTPGVHKLSPGWGINWVMLARMVKARHSGWQVPSEVLVLGCLWVDVCSWRPFWPYWITRKGCVLWSVWQLMVWRISRVNRRQRWWRWCLKSSGQRITKLGLMNWGWLILVKLVWETGPWYSGWTPFLPS